ncbi:unnamed protein product [Linum trigynum]|uniref:DUF4283 domain-containing protein n=1 Tax=Linum trigynum TaxID=586398 RepID=A0AAV2G7Y5_9ROSI
MVGDNYLTVHPWYPEFNAYSHQISSTLVWARLLDIPIHYFHPDAVMKNGARIGKPIRIDHATRMGARSDYARVCVQVDLTKPLLSQFRLKGIKYFIQYEGLEKICLNCGTYTEHTQCACVEPEECVAPEVTEMRESQVAKDSEMLYGEWMIAKIKPRPHRGQTGHQKGEGRAARTPSAAEKKTETGSRFNVLQREEETDSGKEQDTVMDVEELDNSTMACPTSPFSHTGSEVGKASKKDHRGSLPREQGHVTKPAMQQCSLGPKITNKCVEDFPTVPSTIAQEAERGQHLEPTNQALGGFLPRRQ